MGVKPEFNPKDMETVFRSDEAKKLLQIMQKDGGKGLLQATSAIKSGEYAKAASIIKPLLDEPDSELLLQELSRKLGRN